MDLKTKIQTWHDAVTSYKEGAYQRCLDTLTSIPEPCSRLRYNIACVQLKLDASSRADDAIESLTCSVNKDVHFALGYFKRGLLYLKNERLKEAERDFQQTRTLLRGNEHINYKPLGLMQTLHMCEVLHNLAVVKLRQGHVTTPKALLEKARRHQQDLRQEKYIQQALELIEDNRLSEVKAIEFPISGLFTPPKLITENLQKRTYLPKAKVVSALDIKDTSVGFNGPDRVEQLKTEPRTYQATGPMGAVKRLLLPPSGRPPKMKGSMSTGDLRQPLGPRRSNSLPDLEENRRVSSPNLLQSRRASGSTSPLVKNESPRGSLGSLFGANLGVMGQVLSRSCNVLTAVVTSPPIPEEINDRGDNNVFFIGNEEIQVSNAGNDSPVSIQVSHFDETEREMKGSEHVGVNEEAVRDTETEAETVKERKSEPQVQQKKQRPPPPSYPPPPLPDRVVFFV